jgi:hypothetical protein
MQARGIFLFLMSLILATACTGSSGSSSNASAKPSVVERTDFALAGNTDNGLIKFDPTYSQDSKTVYRRDAAADACLLMGWTSGDSYRDRTVVYGKRYQYAVKTNSSLLGVPDEVLNFGRVNVGAILLHECFQRSACSNSRTPLLSQIVIYIS